MDDIKDLIYQHFFTKKLSYIIGRPALEMPVGKEVFLIKGEYKNKKPWFKVNRGVADIYFINVEKIAEFIDKIRQNND